jgi:amidase
MSEFAAYDGLGLAELVKNKEVTPGELVEASIAQIEKLNPQINAVIHTTYDLAREAVQGELPDGPFQGVPFLLKDLVADYAGVPTRSGSRFHRHFVPDHDCELVRRHKAAGLIVLGKTNLPEYGLDVVTEPELFGPCNNPWDLARTSGGSSGGSAAAVASLMVPLAHGSDGGGSIRIPASCCGVFGLKPTRGRTPLGPELADAWHGLYNDHVLTRSVRDSAAMLDATAGPDVGAPYYAPTPSRPYLQEVTTEPGRLRIAYTSKPFVPGSVHADCVAGLEATAKLCQELGHEVVEAAPEIDAQAFARAFLRMVCVETRATIQDASVAFGRKATRSEFEAATWALGLLGTKIPAPDFALAVRTLKRSGRQLGRFFQEYDVLLTPTLGRPPVLKGELQPHGYEALTLRLLSRLNAATLLNAAMGVDELASRVFEFVPFSPVFNATGQPAMSVPLHWNNTGLPIGMQFVGRYGDEALLFRLAGQLERARPWFDRVPPICEA